MEQRTVLYLPGLKDMANGLATRLGGAPVVCTEDLKNIAGASKSSLGVAWEQFPSGDPDMKLRIDMIKDRHVVLLVHHDTTRFFEQMSVILFLQGFKVPHPLEEYAKGKWKRTVADGKFDTCSVASLTIVAPWYRHCQMERTSRWCLVPKDGGGDKWYNGKPDGEYVDVPTALSYATLLSALPGPSGRPLPPQQLLLLDIHEYEDLEVALNATRRWANKVRPYDPVTGRGTYFASAFDHFLKTVILPRVRAAAPRDLEERSFVVFPDGGAHRRFYTMVHTCLAGIPFDHILWIDKTRVGAAVSQAEGFNYIDAAGREKRLVGKFPEGSFVLLADDFTNSGSTLFGGAEIIRRNAASKIEVHAYVTHFVAKYDRSTVTKFVAKLYEEDRPVDVSGSLEGIAPKMLDEFHCTDSIPDVTMWLREDVQAQVGLGNKARAHVMPLAPLIADWIGSQPAPTAPPAASSPSKLAMALAAGLAVGGAIGVAAARASQ